MPIATRLTNTGTLLVNGTFDEFTGAPVVNGNLVLWVDAGQSTSYSGTGNTWTDLSTTGLNGTLVNSPTFSSSPANITFNGTSQRVTFSSSSAVQFLNTAPYTLEAWVYPTQIPPSGVYQGIIDRESNPGTGRDGWNLWLYGNSQASNTSVTFGTERFGTGTNTGASVAVTAASTIGVWQHMVVTYDGTTVTMYRNGVQLTSASSNVNITNTTQTVGFASRGGAGSFLYGSISAAKIYNRALSVAEILQNYNALVGRYGLTANTSGTAIQRTKSNTVLAEQFDEVTYNTTSPAIKNLLIYSQNFEQTSVTGWWGANPGDASAYITTNATTSPRGDNTGEKLYSAPAVVGSTIQRLYRPIQFTSGQTYTFSVYAKIAEFSQFWSFIEPASGRIGIAVNLSTQTVSIYNGTPTNLFLTPFDNGWVRTGFTWVAPATESVPVDVMRLINNSSQATFVGDGVSGVYVWGAQLELGSTATSYQPIAAANTLVSTGMAQRVDNAGTQYVSNQFDEFTGASVVNTNLKLWIDAGQTSSYSGSGTTWTDLSGTSNNLTLTNSPTFNSKLGGGAMTFDGSTNYAVKTVASGIPSGASPFTLSTWFYPTSSAAAMRVVSYGTENTGQLVSIRINAGGAYAVTFAHWGGAGYDVGNGSTVNGNAWNNVTEVFDGTNDYMYINGTLVGTFTPSTLNISASPDFYVGKRATGETFAGSVGQTMLYNRALTADEVASNFNALRNRYGI